MFRLNLVKLPNAWVCVIHNMLMKVGGEGEGSIGGYPNQLKSLKGLVIEETVLPCRWRSEPRKFLIKAVDEGQITTLTILN